MIPHESRLFRYDPAPGSRPATSGAGFEVMPPRRLVTLRGIACALALGFFVLALLGIGAHG